MQILMTHLENRNKGGKRNSTDLPAADLTLVICVRPLNKNIVQFGIVDFQLHGVECDLVTSSRPQYDLKCISFRLSSLLVSFISLHLILSSMISAEDNHHIKQTIFWILCFGTTVTPPTNTYKVRMDTQSAL